MLMDAVFGPVNFRNEVTWKRTFSHGNVGHNYGSIADIILWFSKAEKYSWNQVYTPFPAEYIEATFKNNDPDGRRWQSVTLRNPGQRPNLHYPYTASNGVTYQPHPNGWSCDISRMTKYDREGRLHFPKEATGALRLKMYLDESPGVRVQNIWTDIPPIGAQAAERLGYPTQKPEALLERIIRAGSSEGDLVLDPFCGCGTTIAAAQKLNRQWIGIDITHLAITLMKERLKDTFGKSVQFKVMGEPVSVPDAAALAASDPYQFQWWALGLVGARPVEGKRGADQGIDGKIVYQGDEAGKFESVILSVKAGHLTTNHVRDLRGVVEREKAAIGVLISMEDPTGPMESEAVTAGFHESRTWNRRYAKIQLLTVADLLAGKQIDMPPVRQVGATFKKAPKASRPKVETEDIPGVGDGE
jgi:site-specific DNA-methyltransferase (adenine-specific)